ncbi:MAG: carbohydrate ABC transporter permease [Clostridia bacterium]|nr:carbohydrate ABC transporter permease [Clostridia bacterium]
MGQSHIRKSLGDRIFLIVNFCLLTLFFVILFYPLLYVVIASFSGNAITISIMPLPQRISMVGYEAVFEYPLIGVGYRNSLLYVATGTAVSLAVTICCAYPLSRRDFKGGPWIMGLCVFTMYFSGGLIPLYLLIRNLGMLDTIWSLILPGSLSVFNMIVMRTYFKTQIPEDLFEASKLDGCGDFRYLVRIVLPLSGPIIAVISLYVAVGQWNSYFGPMIFLSTRSKMPLSVFLREILVLNQTESGQGTNVMINADQMAALERRKQVMKYSLIIVSSVPVMVLYPFVQKFFVKGVMVGAVKG